MSDPTPDCAPCFPPGVIPRLATLARNDRGRLGSCDLDHKLPEHYAYGDGATAAENGEAANRGEIPRRQFGRYAETVSALALGGYHLGLVGSQREAIRIVHAAIDEGITFMGEERTA